MVESVIQLKCDCNNYPWGKTGKDSLAARLCEKTPGTDFKLDESKDYAGILALEVQFKHSMSDSVLYRNVVWNIPRTSFIRAIHRRRSPKSARQESRRTHWQEYH